MLTTESEKRERACVVFVRALNARLGSMRNADACAACAFTDRVATPRGHHCEGLDGCDGCNDCCSCVSTRSQSKQTRSSCVDPNLGTATRRGEHSEHTHRPQWRQWCLRARLGSALLKGSLQFWHALTVRSGVQLAGFVILASSIDCKDCVGSECER